MLNMKIDKPPFINEIVTGCCRFQRTNVLKLTQFNFYTIFQLFLKKWAKPGLFLFIFVLFTIQ